MVVVMRVSGSLSLATYMDSSEESCVVVENDACTVPLLVMAVFVKVSSVIVTTAPCRVAKLLLIVAAPVKLAALLDQWPGVGFVTLNNIWSRKS